ncbi:MAG: ribosome recycling factor [Candidatus Kapabacteria bacterium]|jgi:ribosome recycling factor|nr:ribosome recycling factor [Candidatus Kapabacteria bacterium]
MSVQDILNDTKESMVKTVEHTSGFFAKVRTGRASVSLVDGVTVEVYGSHMPLNQVANVSAPDARTIIIQPWDRSTLQGIEKAIQSADLGFNPQNDGTIIRVPVPPLTEERRKEFVKLCKKYAEDGKIAIRNIRRDMMESLKKIEKAKEISEDDRKKGEDDIQKLTDKHIKEIDVNLEKKEKELLED